MLSPVMEGLLNLIGALGLFLYGISRLGDGVQKLAGQRITNLVEKQSKNAHTIVCNGITMAAVLQSNVLTFGIISSLINAGLLSLLPALWSMLGVNLGMTVTAQLMSIHIGSYFLLLLAAGYVLYIYGKKRSWHYIGQIAFSLGIMYLSLFFFHAAFNNFGRNIHAFHFIRFWLINPWIGFLLGVGLAAVFRSSNTVVVLVQGMVGVGLNLPYDVFLCGAIAMVIGANVGTTIINMVMGLDRLPVVKKANWFHFAFNLSTGIICLLALPSVFKLLNNANLNILAGFRAFIKSVFRMNFHFNALSDRWFNVWQIAMAHTLFNVAVIALWLPLTSIASKFGFSIFEDKTKIGSNGNTYLDRRALQSPPLALILAERETKQMADLTQGMLKSARLAFSKHHMHLIDGIERDEIIVDDLQEQITFYLSALLSQNILTEAESHRLASLLHIVSDIERVGDHASNISNMAKKCHKEQLQFSELALNEIELLFGKAIDFYVKSCQAFFEEKPEVVKQLVLREEGIDKLEEELRQNHIHRLNQGKCWPSSGVVYVEMLNNLQRVAAHSTNIASATIFEAGEIE